MHYTESVFIEIIFNIVKCNNNKLILEFMLLVKCILCMKWVMEYGWISNLILQLDIYKCRYFYFLLNIVLQFYRIKNRGRWSELQSWKEKILFSWSMIWRKLMKWVKLYLNFFSICMTEAQYDMHIRQFLRVIIVFVIFYIV